MKLQKIRCTLINKKSYKNHNYNKNSYLHLLVTDYVKIVALRNTPTTYACRPFTFSHNPFISLIPLPTLQTISIQNLITIVVV